MLRKQSATQKSRPASQAASQPVIQPGIRPIIPLANPAPEWYPAVKLLTSVGIPTWPAQPGPMQPNPSRPIQAWLITAQQCPAQPSPVQHSLAQPSTAHLFEDEVELKLSEVRSHRDHQKQDAATNKDSTPRIAKMLRSEPCKQARLPLAEIYQPHTCSRGFIR